MVGRVYLDVQGRILQINVLKTKISKTIDK